MCMFVQGQCLFVECEVFQKVELFFLVGFYFNYGRNERCCGGGVQNGLRFVIVKFRNFEIKIRVICKRQDVQLKKYFFMYDYFIIMNGYLICDLNNDDRIDQVWYFNGKVFVLDIKGKRYKFDVLD